MDPQIRKLHQVLLDQRNQEQKKALIQRLTDILAPLCCLVLTLLTFWSIWGEWTDMVFYLPYLLVPTSILGIIWLSYKAYQARYPLKGSKIQFKRFLLVGVIFTLSVALSGLFGVLEDSKCVSGNILLGDITQKCEAACDKKKKEQTLAQKMEEFTTCYGDTNNIFVDQEKRLTDKNVEKFTHFYQNLSEGQRKEVREKYEQVKKDMQYFKGTQTEEACYSSFSDTIPFSAGEQERKER